MSKTVSFIITLVLASTAFAQNQSLNDLLKGGVKRTPAPQPQQQQQQPQPPPEQQQPQAPPPQAPGRRVAAPPAAPVNQARMAAVQPMSSSGGAGYRLNLPPGWRSELTPNQAVVAQSGEGSGTVVIAPVMAPGNVSAQEYLQRYVAQGIQRWFPNAQVTGVVPSRLGRAAALAALRYQTQAGPGRASALLYLGGGVGTLYIIGAPAATYGQAQPALIGILKSFSFDGQRGGGGEGRGPGAAPAAAQLSYTRFTDPYEGAFSCEVPAGWQVKGGTVRKTAVDVRAFLRLTSPAGVTVFVGDPEIGTFVVPSQVSAMGGLREGSPYSPGYGSSMTIRSYIPGVQFAQEYARRVAGGLGLSEVRPKDVRQRPDLSGRENGVAQQAWTAGEISFEGMRQGRPVAGYVLAATKLVVIAETGMWNLTTLLGFVAPVDQAATATAAIQRVMQTFTVSSQWFGQQQQTTAKTSQIVTETNNRVSQGISDTYWARQRAQDRSHEGFSDYMRGRVRLKDPESGEEMEGRAGNNYYWRVRGTDTVVGGNDPTPPPAIDVTELEQVR